MSAGGAGDAHDDWDADGCWNNGGGWGISECAGCGVDGGDAGIAAGCADKCAASQQAMDAMNQATQIAQANMQQAMSQASADMPVGRRAALPVTPNPVIVKLKGEVSVVLQDADPKAIVFYTIDGSTPTLRSLRYVGPIVVSSKVKVRAMAFDLEDMPSGVVSKTIRKKS
jgi:hypothetical protein